MTKRLAIVCVVLVLAAGFVAAQDAPTGGEGFCATAPPELLAALDGSWSLEQGPGLAVGGWPIPLPAHPPVAMRLEYDAEGGFAILSGQGQQMLMVPVVTEIVSDVLGDWFPHFEGSTEGMEACDWYALPTLIGSNVYALSGAIPAEWARVLGESNASIEYAVAILCVADRSYIFGVARDIDETDVHPIADGAPDGSTNCEDRGTRSLQGDMSMTISLKFDSPSSARGMLTFVGESDGYSFAAWAPITMFR
jgi:hypothetical protein